MDNPQQIPEAFAMLKKLGIVRVELEFSGGNDEGYVESVRAVDDSGNQCTLTQNLQEILEQPIFDKWGGFAGDFLVNGTCIWADGIVELQQNESETVWNDNNEVIYDASQE